MTRVLFYDTETTGLPLWDQPSTDSRQPHILQIAAALVDLDTRKITQEINLLVAPDGWTIDPESEAIHGISHTFASTHGIPEANALSAFLDLWNIANVRVGHVESFDARMIRIAIKRFGAGNVLADAWRDAAAECTSELCVPLNRALGRGHGRGPKLVEAYRYYTGRELSGAHDAREDMLATIDVYFAVKDGNGRAETVTEPAP